MKGVRICQNCSAVSEKLKCCSKCKNTFYCNRECQQSHWKSHKQTCSRSLTLSEKQMWQKASLEYGYLKLMYLNPRNDRTLDNHAADTSPARGVNKHLRAMLSEMRLDPKKAGIMYAVPGMCMPYGMCLNNCLVASAQHGGEVIYGWSLWEGKHVVEAEYHAVWSRPSDGKWINVTASMDGTNYGGYFIPDKCYKKTPRNRIYWK